MRTFAQKQNQPQDQTSFNPTTLGMKPLATSHEIDAVTLSPHTVDGQGGQGLLRTGADSSEISSDSIVTNRFAHDFSKIPVHARVPVNIQPKLAVNTPGDVYELEADRISEHVMRLPEPQLQRACARGGRCPTCQTKRPAQEHDHLQTKRVGSSDLGQTAAPPIVHEVLRSPGQPLDTATRAFFEPRFGHDFSQVRVHTNTKATESTRSVNALAYTVGRSVVLGMGQSALHTGEGRRLLAHELAHVIQQGSQPRMIQRQLYYGGGFAQRPYANNLDELKSAQPPLNQWHPATPDMAATASGSGGGSQISTVDELLKNIESMKVGSITRLNLIGHSNRRMFAFGGKITADNVDFHDKATINADSLKDQAKRIEKLRDRFAADARIVLYGCNAGVGMDLLDAVSQAFGVCVEGFPDMIWWCIELGKKTAKDKTAPMNRGRVWVINRNDPVPRDHPQACADFAADITTLIPGQKSCVGLPQKAAEKKP